MSVPRKIFSRDSRSPKPRSRKVSEVMSANKAKHTGPEVRLRKALWKAGLTGYRLHRKGVPGRPDICFGRAKVAVFVNGCFWHRCPTCRLPLPKHNRAFWTKKFRANRMRDRRKLKELHLAKWTTVVLWECQIEENLDAAVRAVRRAVK